MGFDFIGFSVFMGFDFIGLAIFMDFGLAGFFIVFIGLGFIGPSIFMGPGFIGIFVFTGPGSIGFAFIYLAGSRSFDPPMGFVGCRLGGFVVFSNFTDLDFVKTVGLRVLGGSFVFLSSSGFGFCPGVVSACLGGGVA